jgi:hypothetical protein
LALTSSTRRDRAASRGSTRSNVRYYVRRVRRAIVGEHGDLQTFTPACALVQRFGLRPLSPVSGWSRNPFERGHTDPVASFTPISDGFLGLPERGPAGPFVVYMQSSLRAPLVGTFTTRWVGHTAAEATRHGLRRDSWFGA